MSDYASSEPGEPIAPEDIPVAESGEGESEGQEQAEAELESAAESTEGESPQEHQIEDTIEDAENPAVGERDRAGQLARVGLGRRVADLVGPLDRLVVTSNTRSGP